MGDSPHNLHQDDDEERLARADAIIDERQALQQGKHLTSAQPTVDPGDAANAPLLTSTASPKAPTDIHRARRKGSASPRKHGV
jgi:hypothetical protein